jgi:predicted  nucleic acid-binding Zn-ribbon protein
MREISEEWVKQWAEIQDEVRKTCSKVAAEMARMKAALDGEALAELKRRMEVDKDVVQRMTSLREQVTGLFGHISKMSQEAGAFRKKLEELGLSGDQPAGPRKKGPAPGKKTSRTRSGGSKK